MSNATNTPLTDAVYSDNCHIDHGAAFDHAIIFARQLELSLTQSREREERLRECVSELLFAAENADETGYVSDVGFFNLEGLHAKAHALIDPPSPAATDTTGEKQ